MPDKVFAAPLERDTWGLKGLASMAFTKVKPTVTHTHGARDIGLLLTFLSLWLGFRLGIRKSRGGSIASSKLGTVFLVSLSAFGLLLGLCITAIAMYYHLP